MVTGFDLWSHDMRLRRHWQKRAIAFVIDASLFIPILLVFWLGGVEDIVHIGSLSSVLFFIISYVEEAAMKATAGKLALGLRVKPVTPGAFPLKVLVRNVNRLLWFVLPLLDFALGMATRGDPRQRALDRLAGTTVIDLAETDWHEGHLKTFDVGGEGKGGETENGEGAPAAAVQAATTEKCHSCGGPLTQMADENYQCQNCGLIQ